MASALRKHTGTIVVAMIVAAVTAGAPALANRSEVAATYPNIYAKFGQREGLVEIPANVDKRVGTLSLAAGKYVVSAKLIVERTGATPAYVNCHLALGGVHDWSTSLLAAPGYQTPALQVAGTVSGSGAATLTCNSAQGAIARWIKVTAVRVGTLATAPL